MKRKIAVLAGVCILGSSLFAESAVFGWQKGLSANAVRHKVFEKVSSFKTDSEREAYMQSNGIGGDGPYLDAEPSGHSGVRFKRDEGFAGNFPEG